MPFYFDNELEAQTTGGASWDDGLNANVQIMERGFHVKLTAGVAINSGQMCLINSAGLAVPYDARSLSNRWPHVMAYKSVSSGAAAAFVREGIVRSMSIWSGKIIPGHPIFTDINSLGFAVSSYKGAAFAGGMAVGVDAVYFAPGKFATLPERVTETVSVGPVARDGSAAFIMAGAHRGLVNRVIVQTNSADAYKIEFHSNSSRVSSELQYNTLTQSTAVGSVDVRTLFYLDGAPWMYHSTNENSLANVYGRISVQSGCSVSSANFSVQLIVERFR